MDLSFFLCQLFIFGFSILARAFFLVFGIQLVDNGVPHFILMTECEDKIHIFAVSIGGASVIGA